MRDPIGHDAFFGHEGVVHDFTDYTATGVDASGTANCSAKSVIRPLTDVACKRVADLIVDAVDHDRMLCEVVYGITGEMLSDDEEALLVADLLVKHSLFLCKECDRWLPTTRIDPDKEEWCYGCAREWEERRGA